MRACQKPENPRRSHWVRLRHAYLLLSAGAVTLRKCAAAGSIDEPTTRQFQRAELGRWISTDREVDRRGRA